MIKATPRIKRAPAARNPRSGIDRLIAEADAAFSQWLAAARTHGDREPTPTIRRLCIARDRPWVKLRLKGDRLAHLLSRKGAVKDVDLQALAALARFSHAARDSLLALVCQRLAS
jgi:hypothetical protein